MSCKSLALCATLAIGGLFSSCKNQIEAPKPYGAIPTADQMAWQQLEYYMFVHFGPNTFTDVEWGNGKEDPKVFNPSAVDCRQWAATAKAAGMKGIIITAKHHDGFCLWPSNYSTHTVRESSWKDGKGDLLKELSEACKEYGLKFGVYLSPWDQNHPDYGTPAYNQVFANTLTEVLSNYGEVFEQWFDGANGGAGHGGKVQVYDWNLFHETVYKHQPHAVIFSDVGPGCRWMGNESGVAGATNWSTLNTEGFEPGAKAPAADTLNIGNVNGKSWVPAETDVSIRPGWFYSPSTDEKVKSIEQLVNIYYTSIGRNSNLLLNVPPDRRGRIHPNDSTRLIEFRKTIDESFKDNLAKGAKATASTTRGNSDQYGAANLLNGNYDSYWATDDAVTTASIEISFDGNKDINTVLLQEYIPLGQRIAKLNIEYWDAASNTWVIATQATTIGYKRILRFPTVSTDKIKVNIENSLACPLLNNIELYNTPERFIEGAQKEVAVKTKDDYPSTKWSVISTSTKEINNIIDGKNEKAYVDTKESIIIDLGEVLSLKGFFYVPINSVSAPNISRYNFYVSLDGKDWKKVKSDQLFNNIKNNPIRQDIFFDNTETAKFIKLESVELTNKADKYAVVELGIITK